MKKSWTWSPLNKKAGIPSKFPALAAAAMTAFFLVSCSSAVKTDVPGWLSSFPAEEGFYIGIGGSNTGILADDRELAAAAARKDLAAQISTQVRSEMDVSSSASSDGGFLEFVSESINETVEQNLQEVETVDTWMSPDQGAWVYVRISRAKWASIVNREVADMTLRANTSLQLVVDGDSTEAEEMASLGRTRQSLLESPWGRRVKDEVLGTGGFLLEAVDAAIGERGSSLEISVDVSPRNTVYGRDIRVSGKVRSGSGRNLGTYPLFVTSPKMDGELPLTTDPSGSFSFVLRAGDLGLNNVSVTVGPDLAAWSIPDDRFAFTEASSEVFVAPIPLSFEVVDDTEGFFRPFTGQVVEWFSDLGLPVSINPPGDVEMKVSFLWRIEDFPVSEMTGGMRFSRVGADIAFTRGNEVVAVHSLEMVKDGGLNFEQARQRAAETLLFRMSKNEDLAAELYGIFDR